MAKIRTTERVNWGGWNPFVKNFLEIESKEVSRTTTEVTFSIKDTVIGERIYLGDNNEELIQEYPLRIIREVFFSINIDTYNQLFNMIDSSLPSGLSPFTKEKIREEQAFLYFFKNDKIVDESSNEFCLYGTNENQWQIWV